MNDINTMINIIRDDAEVEVKEINKKDALLCLPEYQIHYRLDINDWYFIEAIRLINTIEIEHASITSIGGEDVKLFSASDLLELRTAIKEDANKLGCIYESYFFNKDGLLKDEVDKRYLLDYVNFINRAFSS